MGGARRRRDIDGERAPFPAAIPPRLNHAVVTGELLGDPREGAGPAGDPVTLLEVEFPVAHPEHPGYLWAFATYEVEVPGDLGERGLGGMRRGTPVLVSGQLSERIAVADDGSTRRPAIVAALVRPGPPSAETGR